VLLAAGIAACAGSNAGPMRPSSQDQSISDVRVDRDGEDTVVTITGVDQPVFTVFAQPNPDRVIVDLASQPDRVVAPIPVHDGLVTEVSLSPYSTGIGGEMTRIEIYLAAPADYEVDEVPGGLTIRILSADNAPIAAAEMDSTMAMDVPEIDPWGAPEASEATAEMEPVAPVAATMLTEILVEETVDGTLVQLRANGSIASVETFTLEDPSRLVVDLPGLGSEAPEQDIQLGSDHVERVRVGVHGDKVRVVIDGGSMDEPFDGRRVVPAAAGLMLALGSGSEIDAALAMAADITPDWQAPAGSGEIEVASIGWVEPGSDTEIVDSEVDAAPEMGMETTTDVAVAVTEMAASEVDTTDSWEATTDETASAEEVMEAPPVAEAVELEMAAVEEETAVAMVSELAPEIAESMEDLPAAQAEVETTSPELTSIYGVDYLAQDDRDRIVIMADAPVDYFVYEPTADTVVLSFDGAKIEPEAEVRITPEPIGPVSLVSMFEQPELENPEVRLVVQRAPNLKPEISRHGNLLIVDFPHTGAVASAPPAMQDDPAEMGEAAVEIAAAPMPSSDPSDASNPSEDWKAAPASIPPSAMVEPTMADGVEEQLPPAAMQPDSSIDVLQEGGLVEGKRYTGRRISLDFKEVDIADVLRLIAEVSALNVIAGDEVGGKVTIRLVDVPWDQALDVVLLTKGLGFMRIGNVLRIAPAVVIAQEQEMRLQERRAKEKLEDLVVKLQPVNYADVAEVSDMVANLLSPRGSVNTDERTSVVIIKDIPSVIDEATALIKAIDTQTPQVMIEAKIVEASLDFSREFGATWGLGAQPFVDGFDPSSSVRQDLGGSDLWFHNSEGSNFFGNNAVFSNPITASPNGLFNLAAFLLDEKLNVELQLQAAEVNGDGKVISSPRIVTLDNKKASIEQGVSIPFQTFENGDAQLEFVDAVLKLEVTPHITSNRSIIMKIQVTRNAPDDSVFTLTGSPAIAKNQVKTETLVQDGQTLVLGGIYIVDKSDRQSRVPYLHSIPLIGAAFRSDEHSESRKELLIFVTPRIVQTTGMDV
jgi:type IV pilus assembly protein PilQ